MVALYPTARKPVLAFLKKPEHFPAFFEQVLRASVAEDQSSRNMREQTALLLFLNHCFGSMEVQLCRDQEVLASDPEEGQARTAREVELGAAILAAADVKVHGRARIRARGRRCGS
ncbi:hypothetical protein MSG28_006943 [Choristoneura fumiferana]|uniref:Uncharacterized protein n=1 Tax=Choristoneura fumiferana TaxID=7141 RepID=A0ACC0JMI4_CHOFU|nr:hypothetical protein MSG28_006943 [Choristoneura fumiferana]